jgi:hypothetical protein
MDTSKDEAAVYSIVQDQEKEDRSIFQKVLLKSLTELLKDVDLDRFGCAGDANSLIIDFF